MEKITRLVPQACIALITSLSLTACTSIGRVPLDVNQQHTIHQANEILATNQKTLEVEPMASPSAAYGGAFGAPGIIAAAVINGAVVHSENKKAEKRFDPIHKNLVGVDFNQQMNQQLSKELKTIKWLHFNKGKVDGEVSLAKKNILINESKGDALVYVGLSYKLSHNTLDTLMMAADVEIYKKGVPRPTLIYQNKFQYFEKLAPLPINEAIKHWADNNAAKARQAMQTGIQFLSKAIAQDIQNPTTNSNMHYPVNIWYTDVREGHGIIEAGHLEEKIGDKNVVRNRFGELTIINDRLVTKRT